MVADALYIEILHKILVCNSGAWVSCKPSRPRCPLDWSVQVRHADWTACCSPGPVQTPDWTDWTMKNTGFNSIRENPFARTTSPMKEGTDQFTDCDFVVLFVDWRRKGRDGDRPSLYTTDELRYKQSLTRSLEPSHRLECS
jgi:hypothetical protein